MNMYSCINHFEWNFLHLLDWRSDICIVYILCPYSWYLYSSLSHGRPKPNLRSGVLGGKAKTWKRTPKFVWWHFLLQAANWHFLRVYAFIYFWFWLYGKKFENLRILPDKVLCWIKMLNFKLKYIHTYIHT
jgi:hypothetical protein